jgi:hypothetical protein
MDAPIDKLKFHPDPLSLNSPGECGCPFCIARRQIAAAMGVPIEAVKLVPVNQAQAACFQNLFHAPPPATAVMPAPIQITAFDVGGPPDRPGAVKASPPPTAKLAEDDVAAFEAEINAYGLPPVLVWTAKAFAWVICSCYFAGAAARRFVLGQPLLKIQRGDQ